MPETSTIGNNIRLVRKKLGLSQEDFAKKLGYENNQTVSNWENGKASPDVNVLHQIAQLGNVSLDWLMGKESEFQAVVEGRDELRDIISEQVIEISRLKKEVERLKRELRKLP